MAIHYLMTAHMGPHDFQHDPPPLYNLCTENKAAVGHVSAPSRLFREPKDERRIECNGEELLIDGLRVNQV